MDYKYLVHKFWYTVWFVAIPAVIAWLLIDSLDRMGVIEEVEVWYVLLVFAGLAMVMYSMRDKLPFWQDLDAGSDYNKRMRRKDAAYFAKSTRKLIKKNVGKLSDRAKQDLDKALETLTSAIDDHNDSQIKSASKKLDDKIERHMSFARKGVRREYFESILVAVIVAVVLRLFVIEAFKIPSESMVPTLMVGDHIFVSKYRYGLSVPFVNKRLVRFAKPARGEVVVFIKPPNPYRQNPHFGPREQDLTGKDFIKRIIGLPGDVVSVRDDIVTVNGKALPRCKIGAQTYRTRLWFQDQWADDEAELWLERHGDHLYTIIDGPGGPNANFGPSEVPEDHVLVMGDNRDNSSDSRDWGVVPVDNIKGRAMFIWWSNRRPHGFQWDRVGNVIMSEPKLSEEQQSALAKCPDLR